MDSQEEERKEWQRGRACHRRVDEPEGPEDVVAVIDDFALHGCSLRCGLSSSPHTQSPQWEDPSGECGVVCSGRGGGEDSGEDKWCYLVFIMGEKEGG